MDGEEPSSSKCEDARKRPKVRLNKQQGGASTRDKRIKQHVKAQQAAEASSTNDKKSNYSNEVMEEYNFIRSLLEKAAFPAKNDNQINANVKAEPEAAVTAVSDSHTNPNAETKVDVQVQNPEFYVMKEYDLMNSLLKRVEVLNTNGSQINPNAKTEQALGATEICSTYDEQLNCNSKAEEAVVPTTSHNYASVNRNEAVQCLTQELAAPENNTPISNIKIEAEFTKTEASTATDAQLNQNFLAEKFLLEPEINWPINQNVKAAAGNLLLQQEVVEEVPTTSRSQLHPNVKTEKGNQFINAELVEATASTTSNTEKDFDHIVEVLEEYDYINSLFVKLDVPTTNDSPLNSNINAEKALVEPEIATIFDQQINLNVNAEEGVQLIKQELVDEVPSTSGSQLKPNVKSEKAHFIKQEYVMPTEAQLNPNVKVEQEVDFKTPNLKTEAVPTTSDAAKPAVNVKTENAENIDKIVEEFTLELKRRLLENKEVRFQYSEKSKKVKKFEARFCVFIKKLKKIVRNADVFPALEKYNFFPTFMELLNHPDVSISEAILDILLIMCHSAKSSENEAYLDILIKALRGEYFCRMMVLHLSRLNEDHEKYMETLNLSLAVIDYLAETSEEFIKDAGVQGVIGWLLKRIEKSTLYLDQPKIYCCTLLNRLLKNRENRKIFGELDGMAIITDEIELCPSLNSNDPQDESYEDAQYLMKLIDCLSSAGKLKKNRQLFFRREKKPLSSFLVKEKISIIIE